MHISLLRTTVEHIGLEIRGFFEHDCFGWSITRTLEAIRRLHQRRVFNGPSLYDYDFLPHLAKHPSKLTLAVYLNIDSLKPTEHYLDGRSLLRGSSSNNRAQSTLRHQAADSCHPQAAFLDCLQSTFTLRSNLLSILLSAAQLAIRSRYEVRRAAPDPPAAS